MTLRVTPPYAAEIDEDAANSCGEVVTVKVTLVDPPGTVTLAGTVATAVLLLTRPTAAPVGGAGAVNVTGPHRWRSHRR